MTERAIACARLVISARPDGAFADVEGNASCPASAAISGSSPRLRTATVATTGTPNSSESFSASSSNPSREARSTILSANTVGSPCPISSSAKRRWLSRLPASTTTINASGRLCPSNRPRTTSRVTASSRLSGSRLYAPGRSISSTGRPSANAARPDLRSTVTPG